MNLANPFMIFSVERKDLSDAENDKRTRFVCGLLRREGIFFVHASGSYEGTLENGFLVFTYEDSKDADFIERLAQLYEQTAVMYVDSARHAYLKLLPTGDYKAVGIWREVLPEDAEAKAGYTRVDGHYYVAQRLP